MKRFAAFAVLLALAGCGSREPGQRSIILASTTSTEHSGLFAEVLPKFTADTGIDVRVVAVGTGQAFEIARRGDADVLLVHDRVGEDAFVDAGHGHDRRDVMFNDFVVIGPAADPADIRGASTMADAFIRVAERGAVFASRGDDSGTHRAELRLWAQSGVDPAGAGWYRELGSGMGPTLNTSADLGAYTLSDRATWASFGNRRDLALLIEGDPALFNPYASLLVSEQRHPHLRHDLAREWHDWIVSGAGRAAIAAFEVNGEQLFFPHGAAHPAAPKVGLRESSPDESIRQ